MTRIVPARERQVLGIICAEPDLTAAMIRERMQDAPGYSAVRALLARLEGRGLIKHVVVDGANVYQATETASSVQTATLNEMVRTFFQGSAVSAATALLGLTKSLSEAEVADLETAIAKAQARNK
jgi:predicted transcriptional regulator